MTPLGVALACVCHFILICYVFAARPSVTWLPYVPVRRIHQPYGSTKKYLLFPAEWTYVDTLFVRFDTLKFMLVRFLGEVEPININITIPTVGERYPSYPAWNLQSC